MSYDFPSQEPTRKSWRGMMNRCYTATNKDYPNIGGKGITVCDRWHNYDNFLHDMGEKPEHSLLSRHVKSIGFTPENTYWEQKVNVRTNRLYTIWKGIKRRCGAGHYKDRGVVLDPAWEHDFLIFARDVGEPPSDEYSLDRIDNNLGYYKDNVRWALQKQQSNNRYDNIYIEIMNERKTISEWCEFYGVDRHLVGGRFAELFSKPQRKNSKCANYTLNGEFIAEYSGVKEAAEKTGLKQGTISKCLSGGNASAGGFLWRYVD